MLDHKKKAITEHWQFCPKCNLKLYRMTADCTGFIHIKCWRCREMLWLNLSIIRSTAAYAPPEVVDGKPPLYPYTPIKSSFEDAGSVEDMMLYTELEAAVHAMIQRLEYSFTFNPSLLTIPKRKQQVAEILKEAETYIWRIKEEMRCA